MGHLIDILLLLVAALLTLGGAVWAAWRALKKSDDPARLIVKWILTLIVVTFMIGFAWQARSPEARIVAVLVAAVCGILLALIWATSLSELVARPFTNLYDGGSEEAAPQPSYSIAEARRKQGRYAVAVAAIRGQLDLFPEDFRGLLLLAEIEAENRGDLSAAQLAVDRILSAPQRPPSEVALALNRLADWHLKIGQDPVQAREALERVAELFPNSEFAYSAHQRIAHLADHARLAEKADRPVVRMVQHPPTPAGEYSRAPLPPPPAEDPAETARQLIDRLGKFPEDAEAREQLATIYVDHYHRLDLAVGELEQLIAIPGAPARQVVHWLNRMADFQVREAGDEERAREALERIELGFPGTAAAEQARNRLAHLRLELRARKPNSAVALGVYEQNVGLKYGPPRLNG